MGQAAIALSAMAVIVNDGFTPRFVKRYANLGELAVSAVKQYREEVESGVFPDEKHTYK